MFEKLESVGEAFRNIFGKKEDEDTRNTAEKIYESEEAKKEYKPTEEQIKLGKTEDIGETENIKEILQKESAKKEEEGKEKDLDEKLADIEKVLSTFGEQESLGGGATMPFDKTSTIDLNRPIDFRKETAKDYLGPVISQPSSQKDRIALLYESLRKQNLI